MTKKGHFWNFPSVSTGKYFLVPQIFFLPEKRCRLLAKEGLVNLTEDTGAFVIHYSATPRGAHGAEISIQISALAKVWTSNLWRGSPVCNS